MDYEAYRPITKTRQPNKQKHVKKLIISQITIMIFFANHNISNPIAIFFCTTQNQSQEQNYRQVMPQPVSQSVLFNEKQKTSSDRINSYPFF